MHRIINSATLGSAGVKTFTLKTLYNVGVPYLVFFFTPLVPIILGVLIFTAFDTFTGMWAAKKRGEKLHSRAMGRTITKMIFYSVAILLAHLLEIIFLPWLAATSLAAGYIALVEFRSNMENIGYITDTNIWEYLKDKIDAFKPREEGKNSNK